MDPGRIFNLENLVIQESQQLSTVNQVLSTTMLRNPGDTSLEVSESVEVAMVDTEEVVITMTEPAEDPRTVGPGI